MDLGSVFVILSLLLLVGLFIARPFLEARPSKAKAPTTNQQQVSALLAERDQVLNALQELDFDAALGKIPQEDYPAQRAALLQHGAEVLQQLDALRGGSQSPQGAENRIEEAVSKMRADAPGNPQAAPDNPQAAPGKRPAEDELEILLAGRRRERQGKAGGFCPRCGGAIQKNDRFCPKCGMKTV